MIESCIHNKEYEDAEHYARHAMFMINDMNDNFIPAAERSEFVADASYYLALVIFDLAKAGGIPPEGKQKAGEEAIELARQAVRLHTQVHGIENVHVAHAMGVLADALGYFNDIDDDEIPRLFEQSIAIYRRMEGSVSHNVATIESKMAVAYDSRATRAYATNDLEQCLSYSELALFHYLEAVRIFRAINRVDCADGLLCQVSRNEENIQAIRIAIEAARTEAASTRG